MFRHLLAHLLLAGVVLTAGCAATVHPRPGEVAAPGELRWDVHLPLFVVSVGRVDGRLMPEAEAGPDAQSRRVSLKGLSGSVWDPVAVPMLPSWWEFSGALGLVRGLEVNLMVSYLRVGGELRWQIVGEQHGAPLSVAMAAGGGFHPFWGRNGPWVRGGLDVSRRFGDWALLTNLYVSYAREGHHVEPRDPPADFFDPIDTSSTGDGEALPSVRVVRDELRLALAVGLAFVLDEESRIAFVVGLVPYVTLDAGPVGSTRCAGCSRFTPDGYAEDGGVAITLGVTRLP